MKNNRILCPLVLLLDDEYNNNLTPAFTDEQVSWDDPIILWIFLKFYFCKKQKYNFLKIYSFI